MIEFESQGGYQSGYITWETGALDPISPWYQELDEQRSMRR